jgi:hypothetical protein
VIDEQQKPMVPFYSKVVSKALCPRRFKKTKSFRRSQVSSVLCQKKKVDETQKKRKIFEDAGASLPSQEKSTFATAIVLPLQAI